jgi:hypothetical protein
MIFSWSGNNIQTRTAPITPDEGSAYAARTTPLTGLTSNNTAHSA